MVVFLLLLILIVFHNVQWIPNGKFNEGYINKEQTVNIKGFFVILVFFSHYVQYVTLEGIYDEPYLILREHLNQMVVAMFLFYSGFGMMRAIQCKGRPYIYPGLPKRTLKVWGNFGIAVILFWITGYLLGKRYSIGRVLLSLIGWESIGNSNWYIFDVLIAYILLFFSFAFLKYIKERWLKEYIGCTVFTICIVLFVFVMMKAERPNYWYNTIILFPFGCWYALLQDKIEKLIMFSEHTYVLCVLANVLLYFFFFEKRWQYGIEGYTLWACSFTIMILLFTMKVSIDSPILSWFGSHVFSIYILQRIPMMILDWLGISRSHKYYFLLLSFVITILIAMIFDDITSKLWRLLDRDKQYIKKRKRCNYV